MNPDKMFLIWFLIASVYTLIVGYLWETDTLTDLGAGVAFMIFVIFTIITT